MRHMRRKRDFASKTMKATKSTIRKTSKSAIKNKWVKSNSRPILHIVGLSCPTLSEVFIITFRWIFILALFCFVMRGWFLSFHKYNQGKTAISLVKNESGTYRYPSVTFCPMFKMAATLHQQILGRLEPGSCKRRCGLEFQHFTDCKCQPSCVGKTTPEEACCEDYQEICSKNETSHFTDDDSNLTISDFNLTYFINKWSWDRRNFLTFFSHPEFGDPREGTHVLDDDSLWTESIPHSFQSGKCYTYNPPFLSTAGSWFGIRFGLKLPGENNFTGEEAQWLLQTHNRIYLHEKGKFRFVMQDNSPSSHRLDLSWLRYRHDNNLDLSYKYYTARSTSNRPCTHEPGYDYAKCIHVKFSEWRGCQPPWKYFPDVNLPMCTNVEELKTKFGPGEWGTRTRDNWDRPYQSSLHMANFTGCPLPCTSMSIVPSFSYNLKGDNQALSYLSADADWTVHIWFKNFLFTYEEEYKVCDWTCLLGEVGGNMGFFLGGSLMAIVDIVFIPLLRILLGAKKKQ